MPGLLSYMAHSVDESTAWHITTTVILSSLRQLSWVAPYINQEIYSPVAYPKKGGA